MITGTLLSSWVGVGFRTALEYTVVGESVTGGPHRARSRVVARLGVGALIVDDRHLGDGAATDGIVRRGTPRDGRGDTEIVLGDSTMREAR